MSETKLSAVETRGLLRLGDVMIPGDERFPSFSGSGAGAHAATLFDAMNPLDRKGVRAMLNLFAVTPKPAIRGLLALTFKDAHFPGPAGTALRLLRTGLKGVVMSLYWADPADSGVLGGIGYNPTVGVRAAEDSESATMTEGTMTEGPVTERTVTERALPEPLVAAQASDAESAFTRARAAAPALARLSIAERALFAGRLRRIVLERREEIIDRIQAETGKSRSDALMSEIYGVLENLAWLEKQAPKHLAPKKVHTPLALLGKRSEVWLEPLGTVLVIAPWNYPFIQALVPIVTALVTGNTVVFKPSEYTPLEGLVEELLAEAGVPPNWAVVVYGDGRVGADLVAQRPDKVFFTGSTRTGKAISTQAAELLVPVELELGGKDAMLVFGDANIARAAAGALWGGLTNTGQSCTSVERLYVERSVYEPFRAELLRLAKRIVQEVDTDGSADIGTMTNDAQVAIVRRHLNDAREGGARIAPETDWDGTSRKIPVLIVDRLQDDALLLTEETFGPLIALVPFDSEDQALSMANATDYGLTASVWTADKERARRVAGALACGGVSINNVMLTEGNPALPFGGVKHSGFGRAKGAEGLAGFSNVKSVLIDGDSAKIEANWYPYTARKYRLFSNLLDALFADGWRARLRFPLAGLSLEHYADKVGKNGRGPAE